MDQFPGNSYRIDGGTLRKLYRLANRFSDGSMMTPDERNDVARRVKALLRETEQLDGEWGKAQHTCQTENDRIEVLLRRREKR
jgi:hypothetical protein